MRILAVDDQKPILDLLSLALAASKEYELVTATSGAQALEIIAQSEVQFDCFLLDIQMPAMDGVELCAKIRATSGYENAPILMVTAMSEKSYIEDAFGAGATDYITKPFDTFELETRLKLAKKLVHENKTAKPPLRHVASLDLAPANDLQVSLHEPVEIRGIERALGYVSFENYLLQLTRGALFLSSVFAIKIADIQEHYQKASPKEFRNILTAAAEEISKCTEADRNLFSYRGNGLFLCITHMKIRGDTNDMLQKLKTATFQVISADMRRPNTANYGFIVGEQLSLGKLTNASTLGTLRNAVDRMNTRTTNKRRSIFGEDYATESRARAIGLLEQRKSEYEGLLRENLETSRLAFIGKKHPV